MTRDAFRFMLHSLTDHELYEMSRKYLLREQLGMKHNSWKCDILYDECEKRNKHIFLNSLKDAITTYNSLESFMEGLKVIQVRRIDYMSKNELFVWLQTAGAALSHSIVDDSSPEVTNIQDMLGIKDKNLFLCTVSGRSMVDAHIIDGDTLVVDRSMPPDDESIVVVTVNDNMLVKRIRRLNGDIWLVSENELYDDIKITEDMNLQVFGVVKHVIHSF